MWLIIEGDAHNLDHFHRIFRGKETVQAHASNRRIFMEMRAGGSQEADARRLLEFPDEQSRDEAYDLIMQALAAGVVSFDLMEHYGELNDEKREESATPMLKDAWKIISNAYEGDWSQAPDMWRARAEMFRENFFNMGADND